MNYRSVCTSQAFSALGTGVVLTVLPAPVLALIDLEPTGALTLLTRLFAGMCFALGATLLAARDLAQPDLRARVIGGNAACDGALALIAVLATAQQTLAFVPGVAIALVFFANFVSWSVAWRRRLLA